jgi:hypothetical protein
MWLNLLVDDHQFGYIAKFGEKKPLVSHHLWIWLWRGKKTFDLTFVKDSENKWTSTEHKMAKHWAKDDI